MHDAPDLTSLSLLERARAHDPEAWCRMVQLYGPLVYQWCRRWGLRADDLADVFQDVFQAVASHIEGFRRESTGDSFRGWLWTIARNKTGDHFRRQLRQPHAEGGSDAYQRFQELLAKTASKEEAASDDVGLVFRALESIRLEFAERTWQAFRQSVIEERATADVAAELGVSPDAVRMAKSRVLRRLRRELDSAVGGD